MLANRNLGRAINTGLPYLRQNYLFTQVSENDVLDTFNYAIRYIYSIDDRSYQISTLLEWNATDSLEIFTLGLLNNGDTKSDFGRLIRSQLLVGTIYRM